MAAIWSAIELDGSRKRTTLRWKSDWSDVHRESFEAPEEALDRLVHLWGYRWADSTQRTKNTQKTAKTARTLRTKPKPG